MTGKGTVNLSFKHSGKEQERRRHSFTDSKDYTWDIAHGNRFREGVGGRDATLSGFQPGAFPLSWMGQSGSFLSYDASGFLGNMPALAEDPQMSGGFTRRSPKKTSKGAALARKLRGLRGSPEPVSSLESCLRAQLADEFLSNRVKAVSRPLNFSSSVPEEFGDEDDDDDDEATFIDNSASSGSIVCGAVEESTSKPRLSALPKLPNLPKFLKECAAKLSISRNGTNGDNTRMKVRVVDPASNSSTASNCPTLPLFETLLFSLGVGFGILFASSRRKSEVKRLGQLLEETQAELETLNFESGRGESSSHMSVFDSANESEEQEDQMAELEAELEAELDQLTGRDSATIESQYSTLDEMDMDASVVYGDLAPAGLPAEVEEDTDEDLSPSGRPACSHYYAVSPRELTRLLRKLQTARQDVLINELEEDLQAALSKLQSREKELEVWKDRVRRLTEDSLFPASGYESLTSCAPTEAIRLVERYSSISDDVSEVSGALRSGDHRGVHESTHLPALANCALAFGTVSEEDPPGSGPGLGLASQGEVKLSLHTESGTQISYGVGRTTSDRSELSEDGDLSKLHLQCMIRLEEDGSTQTAVSARDCKPILDNSQIITQLTDSVHGFESYGDRAESVEIGSATPSLGLFSSSVSISDTLDHPLESATPEGIHGGADRGNSLPRAKLNMVPHPSRRTLGNSDLGNRVLNSNPVNEKSSSLDVNQCTHVVRYSEAMESSKSGSDASEAETADCRTAEIPCSVNFVDSARPVGRAGLTTPVENPNQQFLRTSQTVSLKWSGELSPTVLEKIARWEGLMEGETPGPATGSDWECQSRASDSEQRCAPDSENDDANMFSEENLGLEAEEMLGRMLIKRIVEKSRLGSDSLVKKAQSALATLDRDDGAEADVYHMEHTYMNDRTDSEVDSSTDNRKKQQTGFLDAAVREEYEFFRRLEIISNDRRAVNGVKEKSAKEAANPGGVGFDITPELNLGLNGRLSPGSRCYGARQAFSKDDGKQLDWERSVSQAGEPDLRGSGNWLSLGIGWQDTSRGNGY